MEKIAAKIAPRMLLQTPTFSRELAKLITTNCTELLRSIGLKAWHNQYSL